MIGRMILSFYKQELSSRHVNLFSINSRKDWENKLNNLSQSISNKSDKEIALELKPGICNKNPGQTTFHTAV